jgi:hypothetical protein
MKKRFLIILLHSFFIAGCSKKKVPVPVDVVISSYCGEGIVSYSEKVAPIINANCVGCHDQTSSIKIYDYESTKVLGLSGQLVGCITGNTNYQAMPTSGSLDSCSIKIIQNWVTQGTLNN